MNEIIIIIFITVILICLAYCLSKYNSETNRLEVEYRRFVSEELWTYPYKVREFYNNAFAEGKIDIEEYLDRMKKLEEQQLEVNSEAKRLKKIIDKRRGY